MKKLTSVAFLAIALLSACSETGNVPPTTGGGWSGGESREDSRERSGALNPGETIAPAGTSGFGAISG